MTVKTRNRSAVLLAFIVSLCIAAEETGDAQELRRSGFLGVVAGVIPDSIRKETGLADSTGILVLGLAPGGSAKDAGIRPDDVITAVNGRTVTDVAGLLRIAKSLKKGDEAEVSVRRGKEAMSIKVTVKPKPYESASDVDVYYKAIQVDGSLRRVLITAPKEAVPHPAVLYLTGIGCFTQESLDLGTPDAKLVYGLSRAGFVTMRVEKTGMGDSQGLPCDSTASDLHAEVRSYLAGLRVLKHYPFVDSTRTFILGLSIGGVEAPIVAKQERVAGVIVVNTVAKPFFDYLLETRRRQLVLSHTSPDEVERRMKLEELCNRKLLVAKENPANILKENPGCADAIQFPAPYTYMQEWAGLDMKEEWKAVDAPVLVVYGTSDFVATAADHPYLAGMINSVHPGHATLDSIAGMDHYLTKAASMEESMNRKPGAAAIFEPAVLDSITSWLELHRGID